ncbi:DUF928 domain-containing protein [Calothrix sp. 336/3]|uniref:DUF928 domain-containing protein n=1 Tax=Calothrix sp. 336/3 TaxID=1337936 RepID=UPI0004E3D435|nr:DUF928 domain-containing protein [Calothrix sp. 336/3]AKG20334.1 hypothetical protein IJ00_02485 [Calothrix sp. 336/3]
MTKHQYLVNLQTVRFSRLVPLIALMASSISSSAYAVTFTPPSRNSAPKESTGGASRSSLFTPKQGNSTPKKTTGGASRGNLFTPKQGNSTPKQAQGGASRGNLFTPKQGNSTPKQTTGGGSRVGTYYLNPSTVAVNGPAALIGLMPQSYYGTTISERPTIMVYIPASNATEAVFSLKDEAGNMHHQMIVPVAGKSGVVAVKLPADAPALAVGKNYQWFLALKLDGKLSPSTPYVDGWIQRIQPSAELATALQQKDVMKQAEIFGKNGVWYDCVATLAALHTSQPQNPAIIKQWEDLLTSVSLKEVAKAPLVASSN